METGPGGGRGGNGAGCRGIAPRYGLVSLGTGDRGYPPAPAVSTFPAPAKPHVPLLRPFSPLLILTKDDEDRRVSNLTIWPILFPPFPQIRFFQLVVMGPRRGSTASPAGSANPATAGTGRPAWTLEGRCCCSGGGGRWRRVAVDGGGSARIGSTPHSLLPSFPHAPLPPLLYVHCLSTESPGPTPPSPAQPQFPRRLTPSIHPRTPILLRTPTAPPPAVCSPPPTQSFPARASRELWETGPASSLRPLLRSGACQCLAPRWAQL